MRTVVATVDMTNNIPIEEPLDDADVIDTEFQQVDLGARPAEPIDSIFIEDSLFKNERSVPKRHLRCRVITCVIGIAMLIGLIVILTAAKEENKNSKKNRKRAINNGDKQNNNDASQTADPSSPAFTCASTILTCPVTKNNSWAQLADDIIGEAALDHFGFATALSCDGSILAVSAPENNDKAGHVRVFKWNLSNAWQQMGSDLDGMTQFDEFGTSLSMSADGLRVAIGSHYSDAGGTNSGQVRVFDFVDDIWAPVGMAIQGEAANDKMGSSVSLSADGSRLAIGATGNNATGTDAGSARIFELYTSGNTSEWRQLGQDLDGEKKGDEFGQSVAMSGDGSRVAVGGDKSDGSEINSGQVRVFQFDSAKNTWGQIADAIEGTQPNDLFGLSVSLSYDGTRLAVGARGATQVYAPSNGAWIELGSTLSGGGSSVDMTPDGTRIVTGLINSGLAIVYEFNGTDWTQIGDSISGMMYDKSAKAVAISADGKRVVSSAPDSNFNGTDNIGRVRVYDFC